MSPRPINDSILIQIDEESRTTSGGLVKPEGSHDSIIGTAVVVAVGPGVWTKPRKKGVAPVRVSVGVEPGEGIAFIKFIGMTESQKQLAQWHLEKGQMLIKPNDILLAYDRKNPPRFG